MVKQRRCKDCGTEDVILKVMPKNNDISNIAVELCSTCLHSRAQLQQMKEDKMPFAKLLAKIRSEIEKRVSSEIASVSGLQRLQWGSYKGSNSYTVLSQYWVEQLQQKETL